MNSEFLIIEHFFSVAQMPGLQRTLGTYPLFQMRNRVNTLMEKAKRHVLLLIASSAPRI